MAEVSLGVAAKLEPGNARVWIALAQSYRKLNERAKADAAAAKAARLGTKDALVQKSLAIYYAESSQILPAAEAQGRYARLNPQDAAGRQRAASLYFEAVRQQKFAAAIAILRQAGLNPSPQLELALGLAYYGLREFDEATSAFLATIVMAPRILEESVLHDRATHGGVVEDLQVLLEVGYRVAQSSDRPTWKPDAIWRPR